MLRIAEILSSTKLGILILPGPAPSAESTPFLSTKTSKGTLKVPSTNAK